ncbi:YlbC [Bacillus methanolicus PB1]|uniref:YlbC n=1 Tax=Bacillus methanolicus PB1 TaxID=997296 RepID=I3E554_BACMT|nr:CAP domain-containing protein [Bacillus methanolicus]EIJ81625.1 YlbC [Bacillus methanolicus PB1]
MVNKEKISPNLDSPKFQTEVEKKKSQTLKASDDSLLTLIGKDAESLKTVLGEPNRIDPSYYDYEWWVYNKNPKKYVQAGVENGKVVIIYAIGSETNVAPFTIGQPIEQIHNTVLIEPSVNLEYANNYYRFELSEEDINTRPLVQIGGYFAELYIDRFTGTLSSVRFLDAKTLIKHRPYELVYRGKLIESSPEDGMEKIERGTEQQIFDITNIIRLRYDLNTLKWDEKTAEVAYSHSKDMYESGEFSHTSEKYGDLSNRLKAADVFYQLAGENIAANYVDGPAVVEGWMNSKDHRETLLSSEFTHLGVGVFQKHYTQNFIQIWKK